MLYATLEDEGVDIGGVEAYELADSVEGDAPFGDQAANEPWCHREARPPCH